MKAPKPNPKTKPCCVCSAPIYIERDDYVQMIDFKSGKFFIEGFYHNKCFHDGLKGVRNKETDALKAASFKLMSRVNKLLDKQGIEKETEEFEIV